jgi:DNA-binding transcriptional ArsR family regulator
MSKRNQARIERERKIADARAAVAEIARVRRISETQDEVNALAEAFHSNPDAVGALKALIDSERGRELGAYNGREPLPPIALAPRPAAPRSSGLQEAIIDTLADGELATTGMVIERLGMSGPTAGQRVTVTRALSRLQTKGIVEAYQLKDGTLLRGKGRLWGLAD